MQTIALAQEVDLPGWDLVWRDEFDSSSLDMSKWEAVTLNSTYPGDVHYYLPEHASVVDGKLRITATDEPIEDKLYCSARLESWQAFGPGRFEARIDLPTGQGMAPAFWLYPNDPAIPWPTGGEIDIMENLGSDSSFTISAYHWQTVPGPCCDGLESVFDVYVPTVGGEPVNFHEGFHIFAAEWDDDEIRYYVDGVLHFTVTETASRLIFETPKNIILNLAVGGNFAGNPDETTVFPQSMDVDYVRVWTRATRRRQATTTATALLTPRTTRFGATTLAVPHRLPTTILLVLARKITTGGSCTMAKCLGAMRPAAARRCPPPIRCRQKRPSRRPLY